MSFKIHDLASLFGISEEEIMSAICDISSKCPIPEDKEMQDLEKAAFKALFVDISLNGLQEPIVLLDNKILDGRNRQKICKLAGVEPSFRNFGSLETDGDDPLWFVLKANAGRRHLNREQKAFVAAGAFIESGSASL